MAENGSAPPPATLTDEELQQARAAFNKFDTDGSGAIDAKELRAVLESMRCCPSDEELQMMLRDVDADSSGEVDFGEFLQVILRSKKQESQAQDDDADTLDAFVAMGGNPDKTGHVNTAKLRATIAEFSLRINIDKLIRAYDADFSGKLDYREFRAVLS